MSDEEYGALQWAGWIMLAGWAEVALSTAALSIARRAGAARASPSAAALTEGCLRAGRPGRQRQLAAAGASGADVGHREGTGCDVGVCGACTVLLDGKPVNACLVLAVEVSGSDILVIEGLQPWPEQRHALQENFLSSANRSAMHCVRGRSSIRAKTGLDEDNVALNALDATSRKLASEPVVAFAVDPGCSWNQD